MAAGLNPKVLIVDDDEEQLNLLSRLLRTEGFQVVTVSSPIGVSNKVRSLKPAIVLIDVNIPALSGPQLIPLLRRNVEDHTCKLVLFSAKAPSELAHLAREVGADGYIAKTFDGEELGRAIRAALSAD